MMGGFDKHIMRVWKTNAQEVKQHMRDLAAAAAVYFWRTCWPF